MEIWICVRESARVKPLPWRLFRLLSVLVMIHGSKAFSTTKPTGRECLHVTRMARVSHPYSSRGLPKRLESLKYFFQPFSQIWRSNASPSTADDYDYSKETNTSKLILEAEALRAQAKAIMAQALAMEKELKESRSTARKSKVRETDEFLERWFRVDGGTVVDAAYNEDEASAFSSTVANVSIVASRLEELTATPEQVLLVVDRIFERQMEASGQTAFLQNGTGVNPDFLLESSSDEIQTVIHNETEYDRLSSVLDILLRAVAIVDDRFNNATIDTTHTRWSGRVEPAIRARLNELRRTQKLNLDRKLMSEMSKVATSATGTVEDYVRRSLVGQTGVVENTSTAPEAQEKLAFIPLWVPSTFLPFIISSTSSAFGSDQVTALHDQVLMGSRFFVTSYNSVPGAAIFRGNMRGVTKSKYYDRSTADVFEDIQTRLQKVPKLRDSIQLFFMPDPEWKPSKDGREPEAKPVVLAFSKDLSPNESQVEKSALLETAKKLLYPLTFFTSVRYAVEGFSLNTLFFNAVVHRRDMKVLLTMCMPVVGGILAMQLLHEVVHYLVAKWRRIQIGTPVPIPSLALGCSGCITPIRSFPDSRAALLDFALSGPFATAIASIGCIVASILVTVRASPAALATFPVLPTMIFKSSLLVGTLTSWIASKVLMLPLAQPIPVHPLFMVGYSGLVVSGLNLLPIFRLDGGRACSAAMGPRQSAVISVSMLLFLLSLALSGGSGLGFGWGMFVALFQRKQEIPARDEVTEVDNVRLGAWMFSFLLAIAILTPFPGAPSIL